MKKIGLMALLSALFISSAFCQTKGKSMDSIKGKDGLFAVMSTTKGDIVLELFYKDVPLTVTNFVGLAEGTLDAAKGKHYYDGLKFHRVIADFMIQGGDPQGNGTGGPGYKFADEFVEGYIFDKPGKLAMANSGANTNGSQFFITHVPTDWLNYKHTIFGEVLSGQDVVNAVTQGDTIKSLKIVRQGKDAEAFKVTQKSFDKLKAEGSKKAASFQEELQKKTIAKVIEGCEKTPEGIYYKTLKKGNGKKAGKGKKVTVDYRVYTVAGTDTVFDASKKYHPQGHEPLDFTTAGHEMIEGFDLMVQDMEYGEERHMVLPPAMAYGPRGIPQVGIGGSDYICFDVTLVK